MDKTSINVRAAKSVALEKIKKHFESANRTTTTVEEINKLLLEDKVPKEVYEDSIADLLQGGYLLPEDSTIEDTIVLKIPSYLSPNIGKETWENWEDDPELFNKIKVNDEVKEVKTSTPNTHDKLHNPTYWTKMEKFFSKHPPKSQVPQSQIIHKPKVTLEARHAIMMVPEFNGVIAKKVFEFVEKVDNIYKIVDPNQTELLDILIRNKMSDNAEQLIRNQQPNNWIELRKTLLDHYATRKGVNRRMGDLIDCKQGSGTVTEFASNLQHICSGIKYAARDENMDVGWMPTLLLKTFIDGLQKDIGIIVRAQRPVTYQEALHRAIETESELSPRIKSVKLYCTNCHRNNHDTKDCRIIHKNNRTFNIRDTEDRQNVDKNNDAKFNKTGYERQVTAGLPKDYWNHGFNYNPHYWSPIPNKIEPQFIKQVRGPPPAWKPTSYNGPTARKQWNDNYVNRYRNASYQQNTNQTKFGNTKNWSKQNNSNNRNQKLDENNNNNNNNRVNLNHTQTITPAVVMGRIL